MKTYGGVKVQVHPFKHRPLYPRHPLDKRLDELQSRSGRVANKIHATAGNRTPDILSGLLQPPVNENTTESWEAGGIACFTAV